MSVELQSIESYCGQPNAGGLLQIFYAPITWIDTFPEGPDDNYDITDAVVFDIGKDWLSAKVVSESLRYREPQQDSKQGKYYNQVLEAIIPMWTAALSGEYNRMKHFRFILRVIDREGKERLLGSPRYPFKFSSALDTGAAVSNLKAHAIQFTAQNPNKAYGYNI
jgi:hypothetical protein